LAVETEALALQIADASRFVLAVGKQGFYAQLDQPDNNAMRCAKHTIAMNLSAKDAQHGIDAFLNKKTPIWKDR
jgi:enoyl-CoA hydratase/carnithine racemase